MYPRRASSRIAVGLWFGVMLIGLVIRPERTIRSELGPADVGALEQRIAELETELARRIELGDIPPHGSHAGFEPVPAFVASLNDLDPRSRSISLEVEDPRVESGLAVIGPRGLVGFTTTVRFGLAWVRLVDDARSRVPVSFAGYRGVVAGTGDPGFIALKISDGIVDLDTGTRLVSRDRVTPNLPGGLVVGTVTQPRTNFQDSIIESAEHEPWPAVLTILVPTGVDRAESDEPTDLPR